MRLIGICGKAGVGKDTAALYLCDRFGYHRVSWADPIRAMLGALLQYAGVSPDWMTDRGKKELPIPGIGKSYRELAQTLGTEWGRNLDPEFWLKAFELHTANARANGITNFVVADVRFPNECEFIKRMGGAVLRIIRDVPGVREHESEAHADTLPVDYTVINSGTVLRLGTALDVFIERMHK